MARPVSNLALARQATGLGTSGLGLLRWLGQKSFSPETMSTLGTLGNVGGLLGGTLGIGSALTGDGSDLQKGLGTARGALQATDAGLRLAGYEGVPYAALLGAGLDVGNIAASDLPDDRKAFEAAGAAGNAAATYFGGPAAGTAATVLHALGNQLLFPVSHYSKVRKWESDILPQLAPGLLGDIQSAPDQATLDAIFDVPGKIGLGRNPSGGLMVRGVHFPTGALDQRFADAYARQQAIFADAAANPNGEAAQFLAQLGPLVRQRNADIGTLKTALGGDWPNPGAHGVFVAGGNLIPTNVHDYANTQLGNWIIADQRRGQDPETNPLTSGLTDAMLRLGMDPIADAQRLYQRSRTFIPGSGEGVGEEYDPEGVANRASAEALLTYLGAPVPHPSAQYAQDFNTY